jgi:membrane protein
MNFKIRHLGTLLKKTYTLWNAKSPFRESAVIAYYAIFSMPALILIVIFIAGLFLGQEEIGGYIYGQIAEVMGSTTATAVEGMITKASQTGSSFWAIAIWVGTMIFGATGVFAQLQLALNVVWEVKANPTKQNIWTFIKARLFSFGLVLSIGFLLLISFVFTSILTALVSYLSNDPSGIVLFIFSLLNILISFITTSVLFALIYKILPDAKIKWNVVWIGAFVTSLLFELGKYSLSMYFAKIDPGAIYGPAGSIILILLWVSYSSMLVFFGAEFTKVYSDFYHRAAPVKEIAVKSKGRGKEE